LEQKIESSGEKFKLVRNELKKINESILQSNSQSKQTISRIEQKLNEFSGINDELNSLKTQTTYSINKLSEDQRQMKEELLINQEKISRIVANDILLKIKKMLKKPKSRQKKPQKAKVIMFLKKNFIIDPLSKVLVITDKRNSTFGQILHESVRKLTEKSILLITENRTDEALLDGSVIEAIKQSNYVFIIGKHSLSQAKEISGMLAYQVKIVAIKRSLKYSIL
jgi:hypothetical protein